MRASRSEAVMEVLVWLAILLLATSRYGQGHSLDYEYLPHNDGQYVGRTRTAQGIPIPPLQVYDANIKKCQCSGDEVWDGKGCSETETYVAVTNPNTNQVTGSLTSKFRVTVGEVQCSQDQDVKITLDPQKGYSNQFSLLPNGSLYWKGHSYENYCFDHTLDSEGKPKSWEAKVCLPPPVVPRCCDSLSTASDGSCSTRSTQRFSPPIVVNELVLQWPGEVIEKSVNVKCKEYENLMTLPLNTRQANLTYESSVSLVWLPAGATQNMQGEEYCVNPEMEGQNYVASICYEDQTAIHQHLCSNGICVRKCCPEGNIMNGYDCVPVEENTELLWVPTFTDANDLESSVEPPVDLTWLHGLPQCELYLLEPEVKEQDKFILLNNGKLFRPYSKETYSSPHYCIDNFVIAGEQPYTKALACFPEADPVCSATQLKVYPALLIVSSIFLGVTLVIYINIPDIRDKLHGRCLISLVAALFVAYTLLATTRLADGKLPKSLCSFLASVTQLSLLAAFFWLNVMCFDIWRTLRKTRTVVDGGRAGRRRFALYSLYAWGCPLLITVVAVIVDNLPPSHDVIRPNFGKYCWFQDVASHWLYLYGWVLTLVLANVVFFSLVATILCKAQNDPLLKRSREYNRERMWLYAKLFLVMGVTWLAEVVSWKAGACKALIVTDTLNALQGFTLFLVFVCKRATLNKLKERCGCRKKMGRSFTTITSTLSSFSTTSSASKKRDSNISASIKSSPQIRKSSASPNTRVRNATPAIPLQTLQEAPDEPSQFPLGGLQETVPMVPKEDREADMEGGTTEEATPLKTTTNTSSPSLPLETNFVN